MIMEINLEEDIKLEIKEEDVAPTFAEDPLAIYPEIPPQEDIDNKIRNFQEDACSQTNRLDAHC